MDKVRLGIVGIGNMGSEYCKWLSAGEVPDIEIAAVADRKADRREWAKGVVPESVEFFEEGEDLIKKADVDAVIVAIPHYFHPAFVMMALERGLHVMCEKPAGVYSLQVREMNAAAAKSDKTFAMMFNVRTNDVFRKIKEIVSDKRYGEIKRVNWIVTTWYRSQSYYNSGGWRATWDGEGGGVLVNQCPHNLDLLQWICGMPVRLRAFTHNGKWHDIEVEDDVTCYMEFENGATGVFVTSTGDTPGTNRLELTMEKAKIVCEFIDGQFKLSVFELAVNEREFCFTDTTGFGEPEGKWVEIETDGQYPQHVGVLRAFADHILRGGPLIARGEEGINGVLLANAMQLSGWLGETIEFPFDEELYLAELNKRRAASKKKEVEERTISLENSY